ncbi:TPA: hypothetical protein IQA20_002856, partial [Listeria monocytogenes]|nr:hypothetical protein [Listeria monocytogenes]
MRFSRKESEQKQKNWRMWKKGKQWLCGAALFFTVISSPGMIVLADEVNAGNSTAVTAGEVETPIPEEATENEVEEVTEEDETSSTEAVAPSQQEENTPNAAENNEAKTVEGKKERPKQGRLITTPTAIRTVFPDAALAEAVRAKLNKASVSATVTQSELDTITSMSRLNVGSNLRGLENLRNATGLYFESGSFSDLSPLLGLTKLRNISLHGNSNIRDISQLSSIASLRSINTYMLTSLNNVNLSNMPNLTDLDLEYCQNLSDVSINGMPKLTLVYLEGSTINKLSLTNLENLERLEWAQAPIKELSLSNLPRFTTFNEMNSTQLTNISASDLPLFGNLMLSSVSGSPGVLKKVSLSNLPKTQIVDLDYNQINDVSISNLSALKELQLNNNQISDVSRLSSLTNLTTLQLNDNQISDVSRLSSLTNLTTLLLGRNQISDVSRLSSLTNLTTLQLNNNQISDVSRLSSLTKLTALQLSSNQISDVSRLSSLTKLTTLLLDRNQISDVSPLVGLPNNAYINVGSQRVTLPAKKWAFPLNMTNTVKGITGNILTPSSISNSGQYINGKVSWTDLANTNQDVSYSWMDNQVSRSNVVFSGTATTRITPASVKILVDSDGNSQTTGDQTLFAEATSNLASLEGMYNYAKAQLNGTNYGLINIASDSNGDYVILVSRVGSLKKEDANGTAVGTDVSYTPTYTVTGTGNTAQLEVSYGVTVDAPPTGYVYIYGKGTAQEARSTASTSITIPLTDTNGNGTPQWQEDYTVKQYKKAGALHPSIPGGDLEVIGVPGDAVGGDIVTIPPDTITGSDGREYIVDPSIDIDPNTPGVQITLT